MTRFAQGVYQVQNKQKYVGKHAPHYRSGWELVFCRFCDLNENILHWASEAIAIPYIHPLTGKRSTYIPDFFVVYRNKNGQQIAEVVEIKPKKQSLIESKITDSRNRAVVAVNHAKWASATQWCKQKGYTFRVINEDQIFHSGRRK